MVRYIYSLIFVALIFTTSEAQYSTGIHWNAHDTLVVHVTNDNYALMVHPVQPKQTLYSIARFYGIDQEDIFQFNPQIRDRSIRDGEKLIIRIPKKSIQYIYPETQDHDFIRILYQVQSKETLYGIAKRQFDTDLEYLMKSNNMQDFSLQPGQFITIGWLDTQGVSAVEQGIERVNEIATYWNDTTMMNTLEQEGKFKKNVQNIAFWHKDQDNTNSLYVLHKYARVNSWIEITNPMFGLSIKAKVIGHLPKNTYPNDIDMVVSSKVANELGIIDPRFYVEVSYLE